MPLTEKTLPGVWPALLVPWTESDDLDEARFRREVRAYAGTGVAGVYTGGTSGEFYAQDDRVFEQVTTIACEEAHFSGLLVQIGCTALSTRTVCRRIRTALAAGADGIQIAVPFWLELQDDEVLSFISSAAEAADDVPLILYNTSRARRTIAPPLFAEASRRCPTLLGVKDTGATLEMVQAVARLQPGFAVLGSELDLLEKTQAGGRGTCSSVAMLNARYVAEFYAACVNGPLDDAQRRQATIQRYFAEILLPMVNDEGLKDSAVDRVQRMAGGVDVGLKCQRPYRSATLAHVERLRRWCACFAPDLLPLP